MSPSSPLTELVLDVQERETRDVPDTYGAGELVLEMTEQLSQPEIRDVLVRILSHCPL